MKNWISFNEAKQTSAAVDSNLDIEVVEDYFQSLIDSGLTLEIKHSVCEGENWMSMENCSFEDEITGVGIIVEISDTNIDNSGLIYYNTFEELEKHSKYIQEIYSVSNRIKKWHDVYSITLEVDSTILVNYELKGTKEDAYFVSFHILDAYTVDIGESGFNNNQLNLGYTYVGGNSFIEFMFERPVSLLEFKKLFKSYLEDEFGKCRYTVVSNNKEGKIIVKNFLSSEVKIKY